MMFDKDEEIERLNAKIASLIEKLPNNQLDPERGAVLQLNKVSVILQCPIQKISRSHENAFKAKFIYFILFYYFKA